MIEIEGNFNGANGSVQISIGDWWYDPKTGELARALETLAEIQRHRLEPKVSQVLDRLLAHRGQVISRSELIEDVWADVVVVEETLTRCISLLRLAFEDNRPYRYIETLPKRGYRLVAASQVPEYPRRPKLRDLRSLRREACAGMLEGSNTLTRPLGVIR